MGGAEVADTGEVTPMFLLALLESDPDSVRPILHASHAGATKENDISTAYIPYCSSGLQLFDQAPSIDAIFETLCGEKRAETDCLRVL